MIEPASAQAFEATPAIVWAKLDIEQIAEFAVEVSEAALRMTDHSDHGVGQSSKALGQQPHDDTFPRAWVTADEREPAFAGEGILDAPTEILDSRRHVQCLERNLRSEGTELQAVKSGQSNRPGRA